MSEIIFALDFDDLDEARNWVRELKSEISFFKVGLQLFTLYGPKAVEMVKEEGRNVFLDLKLHDIPRTCALAARAAARIGCYSLTIHIQSGEEALKEANNSRINGYPRLWGVTVLSSISEGDSLSFAETANRCGLDGAIVSGRDVERVKKSFPDLRIIVPGIRPKEYIKKDDQKRVLCPKEAVDKGADFLVIGRPIRESNNPLEAVKKIKMEIE
jgi:orotidine-5'-phosphate decarboxylase